MLGMEKHVKTGDGWRWLVEGCVQEKYNVSYLIFEKSKEILEADMVRMRKEDLLTFREETEGRREQQT